MDKSVKNTPDRPLWGNSGMAQFVDDKLSLSGGKVQCGTLQSVFPISEGSKKLRRSFNTKKCHH